MTLNANRPIRLAVLPFLFSLVAVLSACGGYGSSGSSSSTVPVAGATVIPWRVGATGVETTVKAGSTVQWQSTDGMLHTVTSSSTPTAFAELEVPAGGLSSPMAF